MKVMILGTRGFPNVQGGVEKHCQELAPLVERLGCKVTVITRLPYVEKSESHSMSYYQGVKLIPLSCPKSKFLETIVHSIKGVFVAWWMGCDILHVHAIGPALVVPLARILGMKVVFTHHGPDYKRKKWNWFAKLFLKFGEWQGCRFANEIICVSEHIGRNIEKQFKRKVNIIPNGIVTGASYQPARCS